MTRPLAPHVQAAIQRLAAPGPPGTGPASHVQSAIQRHVAAARQGAELRRVEVAPAPAPHVAATIQARPGEARRGALPTVPSAGAGAPAPHVQAAIARGTQPMGAGAAQRSRHPTLYTHTNTKPHNQITGKPQGPHTVAHVLTHHGMEQIQDWETLEDAFENVPDVDKVMGIIDTEKTGAKTKKFESQLDRYRSEYEIQHGNLQWAVEEGETEGMDVEEAVEQLEEIQQLHPYATYAWVSGKPASQKSLKNKNEGLKHYRAYVESGDVKYLLKLIDTRARFKDKEAYKQYIRSTLEPLEVPEKDVTKLIGMIV